MTAKVPAVAVVLLVVLAAGSGSFHDGLTVGADEGEVTVISD